ncbi:MAG TPA: DUF4214 domain-containing protein [Pyrinomonadaceae bacterium]|nr:DUF4214 domain-containing protein [Pyrinomonadaceae bacterium]
MSDSRQFLILTLLLGTIAFATPSAQRTTEAYFEFRVSPHPEKFIFKLTNPARIQEARDILTTGSQKIVARTIIKQPADYNPQWTFHFDPKTIGFADFAIELCDSSIQGIEGNLDAAYPSWCPWTTQLLRELAPPTLPGPRNLEPTVSMTFPYADFVYSSSAPASLSLRANADDPDGSISKVEFFNSEMKIGERTATPYMLDLVNLSPGTYSISAVATDNPGAAARHSRSVGFTITEPASGNVIDDTQFFVTQHYRDFFSREPDGAGLQFWANNIESCGADAACREVKRIDTSAAFFLSIEFQETGYLAHRFYRASFGRRPLFAEFFPDQRAIGNGVVINAPGWEELLETNKRAFADAWVAGSGFRSIYDGLSNQQFVDSLIANTRTNFTDTDRNAFVDVLNTQAMTRAQVLRLIAEDQSFYNTEYNEAFVEMEYFGYLRRDPDESGFNFWLGKLNQFGGDFRRADMVKSFLVSGEYRQRFGTE